MSKGSRMRRFSEPGQVEDRRYRYGQTFELDGVEFRVVRGNKPVAVGDGHDLRLEWRGADRRWRALTMLPAFVLADFFWENEQVLYRPLWCGIGVEKNAGGEYFLNALRDAIDTSPMDAYLKIARQREAKRSLFDGSGEAA